MTARMIPFLLLGLGIGLARPAALLGQDPDYVFSAGSAAGAAGASVGVPFTIDSFGDPALGWSCGVCSDSTAVVPAAIDSADTGTVNGGGPPAFLSEQLLLGGWTQSVVIDFGTNTLPPTRGFVLAIVEYGVFPGAASGDTPLEFCDGLASPPVSTLFVVVGGVSVVPTTIAGSIAVTSSEPPFIRGDANSDGSVDIADPIRLLEEAFLIGAPILTCLLADDANGDGLNNIADPVYLLLHLFEDGAAPPPPHPDCGAVAGTTPADCEEETACP